MILLMENFKDVEYRLRLKKIWGERLAFTHGMGAIESVG